MKLNSIHIKLKNKGLRITPQRTAIFKAIIKLNNHPTAENIIDYIKKHHPNIAVGTVYKVLDTLVENGLIAKVKTDRDIMRYDAVLEDHHHLYCAESDRIEDFFSDGLNRMLSDYFVTNAIPQFEIKSPTSK